MNPLTEKEALAPGWPFVLLMWLLCDDRLYAGVWCDSFVWQTVCWCMMWLLCDDRLYAVTVVCGRLYAVVWCDYCVMADCMLVYDVTLVWWQTVCRCMMWLLCMGKLYAGVWCGCFAWEAVCWCITVVCGRLYAGVWCDSCVMADCMLVYDVTLVHGETVCWCMMWLFCMGSCMLVYNCCVWQTVCWCMMWLLCDGRLYAGVWCDYCVWQTVGCDYSVMADCMLVYDVTIVWWQTVCWCMLWLLGDGRLYAGVWCDYCVMAGCMLVYDVTIVCGRLYAGVLAGPGPDQ